MHLTQMMIADVLPLFLPVSSLCHLLPIFNLVDGIVHTITCFCFWSSERFTVYVCHFQFGVRWSGWDISWYSYYNSE